jgi:hypothetical protein
MKLGLSLREEHRLRVSGNRVMSRIFGPKSEEVEGGWRRLHDEELHNLYASPNIVTTVKSMMMRWTGHVTRMGVMRNAYKITVGKSEAKSHLEDLGIDGKVILEYISGK